MKKHIFKKRAFTLVELSIVILAISLVIGMVMGGRYLLTVAKLTNLRSITANSPVYSMPSNTFWFDIVAKNAFRSSCDPKNGVNYPKNGDSISAICDVSPNLENNIELTATSGAEPIFLYDSVNGLPLLKYDGVNDNLKSVNNIYGYQLSQPNQITVFIVQKYISGINAVLYWDSGSNRIVVHARLNSAGNIYWDLGDISSSRASESAPGDYNNNWKIMSFVRKTDDTGTIRVDGVNLTTTDSMPVLDVNALDQLEIGSGNDFSEIELREVIIFKRELTDDEIEDVERYLSNKWQIDLVE